MPVLHTGETDADKELARWDTPKSLGGERCDGYEEFPRMVYQARQLENGRVVVVDVDPRSGAMFSGTTKIVRDTREHLIAKGQGWHDDPKTAAEAFEAAQQGVAKAAAEEAYRLPRMSPKAQAEHAAANAETHEHVVEVPIPKKRPYHRTRTRAAKVTEAPADLDVGT